MGLASVDNLTLIGTSHIAKQSVKSIREFIESEDPDIVAIELDRHRYYALTHKKERGLPSPFRVGFKGMLFSLFGMWAEKKMGDYVGVSPGSDMMTAAKLAKKYKKRLVFIDQEIEVTLRRLSQTLTWKEKWHFTVDIVKGLLGMGEKVAFDISKVPDSKLIDELLSHMRGRYPNIFKVLVEERNDIMGMRLRRLMDKYPDKKIVGVVGAGHLEDIMALVADEPQITYEFSVQNFK